MHTKDVHKLTPHPENEIFYTK